MSARLRLLVGAIVVVLAISAGVVDSVVSSPTPTLVGSWGGHQCAQVTVAHPVALPNQGRGRYGGAPYPTTITAAWRINLLLVRRFSTVNSGITLSNDNATINVHVTALPRRMRAAIAALAPKGSVAYYRCDNTLSSLTAIQGAVGTLPVRQGIDVAGDGPTITTNCMEIDVVRLTRAQLGLLRQDFGADKICVHGITQAQVGGPL